MRLLPLVFLVVIVGACGGVGISSPQDDAAAPPGPADAGADTGVDTACGVTAFPADIHVPERDPLGYPPYATDSCSLVYVVGDGASVGELRLRDLKTGAEKTIAPSRDRPRRPSIAGSTIAWEAFEGASSVVRVLEGDIPVPVSGAFDHAGEPRAGRGIVVFTGWKEADALSDTDVFAVDTTSGVLETIADGPGQQRFTDVSDAFIAITDFAEDADGTFNNDSSTHDLADIVLFDRKLRTLSRRARPGKQAFPVLASGTHLGYLDWFQIPPMPKLAMFNLRAGRITGAAEQDVTIKLIVNHYDERIRPAGRNGILEWVDRAATTTLWRAPADSSSAPVMIGGLSGLDVFDPSSSAHLTVVATRGSSGPLVLRGLAR